MHPSSKSIGNDNEELIDQLCRIQGIMPKVIPDGCRTVSGGRLVRAKSPFDRVLAKNGVCCVVDYKTLKGGAFSYSTIDFDQVGHLWDFWAIGVNAGYLVYFRKFERIVFFNAHRLMHLRPGSSLGLGDGLDCGSVSRPSFLGLFSMDGISAQG